MHERILLANGRKDNGKGLRERSPRGLGDYIVLGIITKLVNLLFNGACDFLEDGPVFVDIGRADFLFAQRLGCDLVCTLLEFVFLFRFRLFVLRQEEAQILLGKNAHRKGIHLEN